MKRILIYFFCFAMIQFSFGEKIEQYDIVIYGGNSAGIMAAVQARKMNKSVVVIEQSDRIGGLTSGGLGEVDYGIKSSIGGLALDYFTRIGTKYKKNAPYFRFEPKVALEVFKSYVTEHNIPVVYNEFIDLKTGVLKNGNKIVSIKMESGNVYVGKIFIDASYEGDLMALAGVACFSGREGNKKFNETLNGIRGRLSVNVTDSIDPYIIKGDKNSGLLPRVSRSRGGNVGDPDNRIQAYCYRMCLTDSGANRTMIEKPVGYNEMEYEILFRALEVNMPIHWVFKLSPMPHRKTDSNNHSGISCDYNGGNQEYVQANHQRRAEIRKQHEIYQKGLVWTIQNHPRVPKKYRDYYAGWGLPKDEFVENGNWPQQIYVRESRRMISDYVVTEHDCRRKTIVPDPVAMGSYAMDSHHTQYVINEKGFVEPEGSFFEELEQPYPISYRAIVPKEKECGNLIVPVCVSATHAAYGSIRMEPVFMMLGQSAATIASMAIDKKIAVQKIKYEELKNHLVSNGMKLQ